MSVIKQLFNECRSFIEHNRFKGILVALSMFLAYGFYITSFTLNIDDIFTDFYNGGRLIAAGRFTGFFLQLFTGFLTYSPFFTMSLAVILYYVAGLVYAMVLKLASNRKLSDASCFVFWIVFVTYPIIAEQFVYPIIHLLSLGYLFVAVALHLILQFLLIRKWRVLIPAFAMMVLAIDFYEAFASVFLTFLMCLLIVRYLYGNSSQEQSFSGIAKIFGECLLFLSSAIIVRTLISVAFMYTWYGTTQSGYSGNASLYWFSIGPFDCAFWLARTVFLNYFWAAVAYFPIFSFALSVFLGGILTSYLAIKRKTLLPFLLFVCLICAALSLSIILGLATNYTMAQALTPFVAFVITWCYASAEKCHFAKGISIFLISIFVINQAKSLNTWSVLNYKRSQYEFAIIDSIGRELVSNYPVQNKPVLFLGGKLAPHLPESWQQDDENIHPLIRLYKKSFLKISERYLPPKYLHNMGEFCGQNITSASELYRYIQYNCCRSSASYSYMAWLKRTDSWFEKYKTVPSPPFEHCIDCFAERGFILKNCSMTLYQRYKDSSLDNIPAYPLKGYIHETEDAILVNLGR